MTVQAVSGREPCLCREQGSSVRGFVATNLSPTTTASRLLLVPSVAAGGEIGRVLRRAHVVSSKNSTNSRSGRRPQEGAATSPTWPSPRAPLRHRVSSRPVVPFFSAEMSGGTVLSPSSPVIGESAGTPSRSVSVRSDAVCVSLETNIEAGRFCRREGSRFCWVTR